MPYEVHFIIISDPPVRLQMPPALWRRWRAAAEALVGLYKGATEACDPGVGLLGRHAADAVRSLLGRTPPIADVGLVFEQ